MIGLKISHAIFINQSKVKQKTSRHLFARLSPCLMLNKVHAFASSSTSTSVTTGNPSSRLVKVQNVFTIDTLCESGRDLLTKAGLGHKPTVAFIFSTVGLKPNTAFVERSRPVSHDVPMNDK